LHILGIISEVLWVCSFGYSCNYNIFFFIFGYFIYHIHNIFGYKHLGIRAIIISSSLFLGILSIISIIYLVINIWVFVHFKYSNSLIFGYSPLLYTCFIWV